MPFTLGPPEPTYVYPGDVTHRDTERALREVLTELNTTLARYRLVLLRTTDSKALYLVPEDPDDLPGDNAGVVSRLPTIKVPSNIRFFGEGH